MTSLFQATSPLHLLYSELMKIIISLGNKPRSWYILAHMKDVYFFFPFCLRHLVPMGNFSIIWRRFGVLAQVFLAIRELVPWIF